MARQAVRRSVPVTHARMYLTGRIRHDEPTYLFSPTWLTSNRAAGRNTLTTNSAGVQTSSYIVDGLNNQGWHPFIPTTVGGTDHLRILRESDRVNGIDLKLKFVLCPLFHGGVDGKHNPAHYGDKLPTTWVPWGGSIGPNASLSINGSTAIGGGPDNKVPSSMSVRIIVFEYSSLYVGGNPMHRNKWTNSATYGVNHQVRADQPHAAASGTSGVTQTANATVAINDTLDINTLTIKKQQQFNNDVGDPIEGFWDDFFVGVDGQGHARFPLGPLTATTLAAIPSTTTAEPVTSTDSSGQFISHFHDQVSKGEESKIRVLKDKVVRLGPYDSLTNQHETVCDMRIPLKKLFKWDNDAHDPMDLRNTRSGIIPHRDIAVCVIAHDDDKSFFRQAGSTIAGIEMFSDFAFRNTVA